MSLSMHAAAVPPLQRTLTNLAAVLAKAEAHAEAGGIDPAVLLASRLYPDMFPLTRQVQIAADIARRGVARLAGVEAVAVADDETTFAQLIQRLEAAVNELGGYAPDQLEDSAEREVSVPIGRGQSITMIGWPFLSGFVLPNVYFHTTTAYGILRHNGVVLGKRDFLGEP